MKKKISAPKDFFISRVHSFGYAFRGWWYVIRTQRNAWIHAVLTMIIVLFGFWLRLTVHDWAVLFLTIALVWIAEFINSALEIVVDLVSPRTHPLAARGKDVGAAAVLIAALTSILVGIIVLGPKLLDRIEIQIK